ncbi:MAG: hypothetical protein CVV41_12020 [Candidatus Riflebacteria bacterium HGW-Riflebacteria-1]|jgi:hypothetical protein|nr:MAG: hypothetical protein CVV41_12020 [Candidatus Riflebacteria bacterium HGW-Riflebacteria-1]
MNNFPDDEKSVEQNASSENSAAGQHQADAPASDNAHAGVSSSKPGLLLRALRSVWDGMALRRVIFKALTLIYALIVFGYAYFHMEAHRNIMSYMGVMLLMVIVYAEILVIRDHLWVIEGSMRESRRWRDVFFNQTSLRRQRIRKFISIAFSLGIFSYMYFKAGANHKPVLSFMGVMLMMTVLYYEILTIRDEIFVIGQSLAPCSDDESDKRKQHYDKFIEQARDELAGDKSSPASTAHNTAELPKTKAAPIEPPVSQQPKQNG